MSKNNITIDLSKLTLDSRMAIHKALEESQAVVKDSHNAIALVIIKQFKKDNIDHLSGFEQMCDG